MTTSQQRSVGSGAATESALDRTWRIETGGIDAIPEDQRHGRPVEMFWLWCGANIGILAITYGTYLVTDYGLNLWESLLAAVLSMVVGWLGVGVISLAGKRSGAPTMVVSRASFGRWGNRLPALINYVSLVGWEVLMVALGALACEAVLSRLGILHGNAAIAVSFVVIAAGTFGVALLGHASIVRINTFVTYVFGVMTILFVIFEFKDVHWDKVSALHPAGALEFIGGMSVVMAGFGISWFTTAADYTRYLPRSSSSRAVVGWTTLGASVAPFLLISFGALLAASNSSLASSSNPIGALAAPLPTWFLVPYLVIAAGGFILGGALDMYSAGLSLMAVGVRLKRSQSIWIDGALMVGGNIYILFYDTNFVSLFEGFLLTLGVPLSAWGGLFIVDMVWRRRNGYPADLLSNREGDGPAVNWPGLITFLVATFIGLGLITSTSSVFSWVGYFISPTGVLADSSIGLLVAFGVAVVVYPIAVFAERAIRGTRPAPALELEPAITGIEHGSE
jgi:nucleobase:cation symporter-1, NCS1 family